ncbi:MAG: sigma-70 family RNA polymerase sigma factor [Planctomycetota bacterium]|nr:sigma-70 family RNA polymerase sigma factor [Planctomycetota bacterium]
MVDKPSGDTRGPSDDTRGPSADTRGPVTAGRRPAASKSRSLSLSDLEIPVQPLLTREEEHEASIRVQVSLGRLNELLPRHPLGYLRYQARMSEVVMGGGPMFSWLSLREGMANDLKKVNRSLKKAEALAATDPEKAIRAYESGVKVLRTYPLYPEILFQWSKEVLRGKPPRGELAELGRFRKVVRLARRSLDRLQSARDQLVLPNLRLVLKEVFRYRPTGMRHSDLFQEGVLGLHKAVFRFDPYRATRFSTYATYWIRQAIRKSLIDKSRMIRVPQAVQEALRKRETRMLPQEVERVRRVMSETMLFSAGDSDDGGDRNSFVVPDPMPGGLGEDLHTAVIPGAVSEALRDLDSRSREVVKRRFGIGGSRPQTLEEIGRLMNLSRERIRQIEREALGQMRRHTELEEVYEDLGSVAPVGSLRS